MQNKKPALEHRKTKPGAGAGKTHGGEKVPNRAGANGRWSRPWKWTEKQP